MPAEEKEEGIETPEEPEVETPAPETAKTDTVPKERLDSALEKVRAAEERLQLTQSQLQLLQANLPRQEQKVQDLLEGIFKDDDTVVDKDQLKEVVNRLRNVFGSSIAGIQTMLQLPEYTSIVQKHLPNVINNNPALAQTLQFLQSTNPQAAQVLAYELAKTDPKYIQSKTKKSEPTPEEKAAIESALKAAQQPGSASSVTGPGSLNLANVIANESDEKLEARIARVKAKE